MRVILTGSSGRIGRAIFGALSPHHEVVGIDQRVFSTTHVIGDCGDAEILKSAFYGADAVIHTAGPHAPHVGVVSDAEFERVNIEGTRTIFEVAREAGVRRMVYTSTTALYGHAIEERACTFVTEETEPGPKSIYHRTNLAAESLLEHAASPNLQVRVLRMSRCFPEPAPEMAVHRLHRGVDARDVASGHALALEHDGPDFDRFILSGAPPFQESDCDALAKDAAALIRAREPDLASEFDARGWDLPQSIDRIYSPAKAQEVLGWRPRWDWREVIAQTDRDDLEVLPAGSAIARKSE